MADGAYERRGPREAELKRLQRLIEERRSAASAANVPDARHADGSFCYNVGDAADAPRRQAKGNRQ